jgi:hypothetical protein
MKVACIGNMNNIFFSLVRFLRDKGYEADLILTSEQNHFLPENDSFRIDEYNWIKEIKKFPWPSEEETKFTLLDKFFLKQFMGKYDFLIGCGYAPGMLNYLDLKLNMFIPYGSDYYLVPFRNSRTYGRNRYYNEFGTYQKQGIINSDLVILDHVPLIEEKIGEINLKGLRVKSVVPSIYTNDFNPKTIPGFFDKSALYPQLRKLRDENDFIVLQQVRQTWITNRDGITNKGNDRLIRGYSEFLKKNKGIKSKLILFEYGDDVKGSKDLISGLNMDSSVVWLPLSPRKEIMVAIYFADVCVGELHDSFLLYGAVGEYLSMGKPFIHSCVWDDFKPYYNTSYPINYANSAEGVLEHLTYLFHNPERAKEIGVQGYNWFIENAINKPLELIMTTIETSRSKSN